VALPPANFSILKLKLINKFDIKIDKTKKMVEPTPIEQVPQE